MENEAHTASADEHALISLASKVGCRQEIQLQTVSVNFFVADAPINEMIKHAVKRNKFQSETTTG